MARTPVEAILPNTTMEVTFKADGTTISRYYIFPIPGYALHDNAYDEPVYDEEGNETGEWIQKFTTAFTTVLGTYDFEANPDNIFAVPLSELDENQLCGDTDEPDHEVM